MPSRKEVAPELIAEGKYLYEKTLVPTDEIGARMGFENANSDESAMLFARVVKAAHLQVDAIESVHKMLRLTDAVQSERAMRILGALNKMLRELATIAEADEMAPPDEIDNDPIPRDIDEFRRELARRLKGLVDAE